jgi:hypothetical protein
MKLRSNITCKILTLIGSFSSKSWDDSLVVVALLFAATVGVVERFPLESLWLSLFGSGFRAVAAGFVPLGLVNMSVDLEVVVRAVLATGMAVAGVTGVLAREDGLDGLLVMVVKGEHEVRVRD